MKEYTLNDYLNDIDTIGLEATWDKILKNIINDKMVSNIFKVENFGELYEIGLERINKISKKEMGKYYTPSDVAKTMSRWLVNLKGENICDVCCGVGNLILNYFEVIGKKKTINLLENKMVYLYDLDKIAIKICKYSIAIKYGKKYINNVNDYNVDFLNKNIKLPKNSKVISNPPYYKITEFKDSWNVTKIMLDTKELYSVFMEKIIQESDSSVIITPYSFIGALKFDQLRKLMNNYNGFIVSFDNVPGALFNGAKHGVFNSNKSNSVRAAITVVENKGNKKGFRLSPLIRFKSEERNSILNNGYLYSIVNNRYQIIDNNKRGYYKCYSDLLEVLDTWENKSNTTLGKIINKNGNKTLYVPTTCRYFTVASSINLKRDGKRIIKTDKQYYNYLYCLINSSFAYWYWRLYDGGINYPLTIINSIPSFYDIMSEEDKKALDKIAKEMQEKEKDYLVYKLNAGKYQENIKFPLKYRKKINSLFFKILGINLPASVLDKIHSSSMFKNEGDELNE